MLVACKPSAPSYLRVPPCTRAVRWASYPAIRTGSSNTLFYPAVRTGSSNTHFFFVVFFFFLGGHLPQTSSFRSAKEILVVSFATQPRTFILSDRNIFYTPGGGRTTAGSNAPGAFLVFSLSIIHYYSPPSGQGLVIPIFKIFTLPSGRGLVIPIFTPPSGRGLVIPIFFPWFFFFFWWSLAPDVRFSLGQTNTRRVFRYTGKGFYLE